MSTQDADPLDQLAQLEESCREALTSLSDPVQNGAELHTAALARLLEISRAMNQLHDRERLLQFVCDRLGELFDAENSFVVLFEPDGSPRVLASSVPADAAEVPALSATILEKVRSSGEPILIDDTTKHPELSSRTSIEELKISSVLCAPLIVEERVIGVLQFDHRGGAHPFPPGDFPLLTLFAGQVATAFHNLQLIEKLNQTLADVRAAQVQLVQAERLAALGQMAGGIAHDFNNTLFIALGISEVQLAKPALDGELRGALERIRTCALDAASTVRRLQVFSRGQQVEVAQEIFYPSLLAEEVPELTRAKWADEALRRGVSIEVTTALEAVPPVRANPAEVREVLINLVFNAVDSMEQNGAIQISTGSRDGRAFFAVRDEGVGIDAATRERIFEPFFTTKGARGFGFGLSTSWAIARRLGGELQVESQPGRGSTFTLWLPLAGEALGRPVLVTPGSSAARAHILIVDDDALVLETVQALVTTLGHSAVTASSGERAFELLAGERFDLVLTDMGMPSVTGLDVARTVRERWPRIPVVLLTGWGSDRELEEYGARSLEHVLAKPITREALGAALERALAAREAEPG